MSRWDIFVSYSRADAGPALTLARALRDHGLRVFWDEQGVSPFQPISRTILDELASSRVLLAYFSTTYPLRRACQHELTAAFLAGQQEGDPGRRVLVVNPEPTSEHIHPIELRDSRHAAAPRSQVELTALVERIHTHVADIDRPLGSVEPLTPPLWLPAPTRPGAARFVGRLPELWHLHSALHPHVAPLTTAMGGRVAVVHGMTGIGKTSLVEEYAHRFSAAFPGGIFWLSGNDRPRQLRAIASALTTKDVSVDRAPNAVATALHDRGVPCLWVVDDVPSGLPITELLGPHPLARSVIITRDRSYAELGVEVEVGGLDPGDARKLLPEANDQVIEALGGHPQALTLLASSDPTSIILRTALEHPRKRVATSHTNGERAAAWRLQLELADRLRRLTGTHLRAELSSLHALFDITRTVMRQSQPIGALGQILLEQHLRPLLTHWHPALSAHEAQRRADSDPVHHENRWQRGPDLRNALTLVQEPLRSVLQDLSVITGSGYGL